MAAFVAALATTWEASSMIGRERDFGAYASRVQAHVAALADRRDAKGSTVSTAVFRFDGADGSVVDVSAPPTGSPSPWQVGQSVELLYNAHVPPFVEVDSLRLRWGYAALLGLVAASLLAAGLVALRSRR